MKLQKVKDYAKCVYANKATFVGYVSAVVVTGTVMYLGDKIEMNFNELNLADQIASLLAVLSGSGLSGLGITMFGYETYNAYVRTKKDIKRYGSINQRYINSQNTFYCNRVGVQLAIKEAGLEDKLKEKNM